MKRFIDIYWGSKIAYDVPALAFYLLVLLAPLTLGLSSLAGIVFSDFLRPEEVARFVSERFPEEARGRIINLAQSARDQIEFLLLAIFAMAWTAGSAMGVLERAEVRVLSGPGFGIVEGRLRLLGLGLAFSLVLLISLAASSALRGLFPLPPLLVFSLGALGVYLGLSFLYWVLPRPRAQRPFFGALFGTFGVVFAPLLASFYASFSSLSFGGIFAWIAIVIFSLWLMANALLIGAVLSSRK